MIELKHLSKTYRVKRQQIDAVKDLSLQIHPQETLGLVGESGSGKTTIGRMLTGLITPTSGLISYQTKSLEQEMQMIFQDPYSSLNPRMRVKELIEEPLIIHRMRPGNRARELLNLVGLASDALTRYPHEFSGGQRQRIGIARALALNPQFIVCDEPIAALDVSIQAQIVNLLTQLQRELGLTYLFISHDLAMVQYISDRIAVMYRGHLMELASKETLYKTPSHPYTKQLLASIPSSKHTLFIPRDRVIPPTQGCPFSHRCPYVQPICHIKKPPMRELHPGHKVSCYI